MGNEFSVGSLVWASVLLLLAAFVLYACPGDDGISDCSSRNKPQYRDERGNWTCKDRK